jgi:hypothetical protein
MIMMIDNWTEDDYNLVYEMTEGFDLNVQSRAIKVYIRSITH